MAGENLQPRSVVNTDGLGSFRGMVTAGCYLTGRHQGIPGD